MTLEFDEHGLLAPGIRDATLDEIEAVLGSSTNSRERRRLFTQLREYVAEIQKRIDDVAIILDGSFVIRTVEAPHDIDLLVLLPPSWDFSVDLRPLEYNLLSTRRIRKRFEMDVFPVIKGSAQEANWIEFFSGVRAEWIDLLNLPSDSRKGSIRVVR